MTNKLTSMIILLTFILSRTTEVRCKFEKVKLFLANYEISQITTLPQRFKSKMLAFEKTEKSVQIKAFGKTFILDLTVYFPREDSEIMYISKKRNTSKSFLSSRFMLNYGFVRDVEDSYVVGYLSSENKYFRGYIFTDEVYCSEPYKEKKSNLIYRFTDVIVPGCSKQADGGKVDCSETWYYAPWKATKPPTNKILVPNSSSFYDKHFELFNRRKGPKIGNETLKNKNKDDKDPKMESKVPNYGLIYDKYFEIFNRLKVQKIGNETSKNKNKDGKDPKTKSKVPNHGLAYDKYFEIFNRLHIPKIGNETSKNKNKDDKDPKTESKVPNYGLAYDKYIELFNRLKAQQIGNEASKNKEDKDHKTEINVSNYSLAYDKYFEIFNRLHIPKIGNETLKNKEDPKSESIVPNYSFVYDKYFELFNLLKVQKIGNETLKNKNAKDSKTDSKDHRKEEANDQHKEDKDQHKEDQDQHKEDKDQHKEDKDFHKEDKDHHKLDKNHKGDKKQESKNETESNTKEDKEHESKNETESNPKGDKEHDSKKKTKPQRNNDKEMNSPNETDFDKKKDSDRFIDHGDYLHSKVKRDSNEFSDDSKNGHRLKHSDANARDSHGEENKKKEKDEQKTDREKKDGYEDEDRFSRDESVKFKAKFPGVDWISNVETLLKNLNDETYWKTKFSESILSLKSPDTMSIDLQESMEHLVEDLTKRRNQEDGDIHSPVMEALSGDSAHLQCNVQLVVSPSYLRKFENSFEAVLKEVYTQFTVLNRLFQKVTLHRKGTPFHLTLTIQRIIMYSDEAYSPFKQNANLEFFTKARLQNKRFCLNIGLVNQFLTSGQFVEGYTPEGGGGVCAPVGNTLILSHGNENTPTPMGFFFAVLVRGVTRALGANDRNPQCEKDSYPNPMQLLQDYLLVQTDVVPVEVYSIFTTCNIKEITDALKIRDCLIKITNPLCGNGILDEGEQCDCGPAYSCDLVDPCCNSPQTEITSKKSAKFSCTLLKGAECSSSQDCCSACAFSTNKTVCHSGHTVCDIALCDGASSKCPTGVEASDGMVCSDYNETAPEPLVCKDAKCELGLCTGKGLKPCTCARGTGRDCAYCCVDADGKCRAAGSQLKLVSNRDYLLPDGVECIGGTCSLGKCLSVSGEQYLHNYTVRKRPPKFPVSVNSCSWTKRTVMATLLFALAGFFCSLTLSCFTF